MVYKKIFICFAICCLVASTQGCYINRQSTQANYADRWITQEELDKHPDRRIQRIITVDRKVYEFPKGAFLKDGMIVGYTSDGKYVSIPRDRVKAIYVHKQDEIKSHGACCAITGLAVFICLIYLILNFRDIAQR